MSAPPDPTLEHHKQCLEESLEKLRKALKQWQVFSAEYEAFREELQRLPDNATREDMLAAGMDFGGTVVDEKEIKALLGDKVGIRRTVGQVITTVSHRINYVQENVAQVEKQIEKGETKLASLLVVAGPDLINEEGLPIMDIREELDEEDNVISATVNGNDPTAPAKPVDVDGLEKIVAITKDKENPGPAPELKALDTNPKKPSPLRQATTQDPSPPNHLTNTESYACEPKNPRVKVISSKEEDGGGRVKIVDDIPEAKKEDWVQEIPGESEEDTEMRRQMLKYNMQEIGAVVAEINLDEEGDYYGYEDSDDYDEDEEEDEEDEEEDSYGRATYKVITPELQREMEELQKRVLEWTQAARNGGAKTTKMEVDKDQDSGKKGVRFAKELDIAPPPTPAPTRHITTGAENIRTFPTPPSAANTEDAIPLLLDLLAMDEMRKEGMRKEEMRKAGIQIAGETQKTQKPSIFKSTRTTVPETIVVTSPEPSGGEVMPESVVASTVLERPPGLSAPDAPTEPPSLKTRKPSRFMAAKAANATTAPASIFKNTTPSASESKVDDDEKPMQPIMSNFIKEREPSAYSTVEPPDELDPSTHRREVATEFHRMRTKMMQQQGGFTETEDAMVPLNQDGEKRKISRFKAARIKAMGQ